jgi:uncharacterized protein (DUF433 family)
MALQEIRRISTGIVQDPSINSGRPIIEGTRSLSIASSDIWRAISRQPRSVKSMT